MIINLSHYKGGVGKTTLTINLAISLNASILDLDGLQSSFLFNKLRKTKGREPLKCYTAKDINEMKTIFHQFANKDEILIVDSGGYDSEENRFAMLSSTILITPVSFSQVELFALQKYELILKEISQKYGQDFKTNVVINNTDVRSKSAISSLKKFVKARSANFDLFDTIIHSRSDYKKAYSKGVSVVEMDAESKAANEIESLINEIRKEINCGTK